MMETLAQTFVVAPSHHEESGQHLLAASGHSCEDEDDDGLDFEQTCSADDDDSASFYDDDDQSLEDDSEGSLENSGYLGTARYFSNSTNMGSTNMEPQMIGFSNSFVTDEDYSERCEDLCEEDFGIDADPNYASQGSGNNLSASSRDMEESVHEDVLSFDQMLGKKQSVSPSLDNLQHLSHASLDDILVVDTPNASNSKRSQRTAGQRSRSRSASRSRSRSTSQSNHSRHRSRSRSRESGVQPELPPTLMPMPTADDEEENMEDMFSVLALSATPRVGPKGKIVKPPQPAPLPPQLEEQQQQQRARKSHRSPNHSHKTRSRSRGRGEKLRRKSHHNKKKQEEEGEAPDQAAQAHHHKRGSRRGSIQARRQNHRLMDASCNNGGPRQRRPSMNQASDQSNGMGQSSARMMDHSKASDTSARHGSMRRADFSGRRSLMTPGVGGAANRRKGSYRGLMSPELIAEQLQAEDEAAEFDAEIAHGLRRSQNRNMTRLGRRRGSIGAEGISKSEVVKSSRRASEQAMTASANGPPLRRMGSVEGGRRGSIRQASQKCMNDSQRQLCQRQMALQRHASVNTVETHSSTETEGDPLAISPAGGRKIRKEYSTKSMDSPVPNGRPIRKERSTKSMMDLGGPSPSNARAIRRMSSNAAGSARDVMTAPSPGTAKAIRQNRMSHRDRIRRHLSNEPTASLDQSSGDSLDEEPALPVVEGQSRRERRKSALQLKGQPGFKGTRPARKITRCRSEPTEKLNDIMYACDIDEDTVAALGLEEPEEDDEEEENSPLRNMLQKSGSTKVQKALQRQKATENAKKATAAAANMKLKK